MAAEKLKCMYGKMNSSHPITVEWFSMQILLNFKIFKPSINLKFLKVYEAQIFFCL